MCAGRGGSKRREGRGPTGQVVGAFATLPILLVWIYLGWVIVLLGAVIAAYAPSLQMHVARWPERPGSRLGLAVALLTELERAAALMGRSYLDGSHDEARAKARLRAAQDLQAGWSDEQRLRLRLSCDGHADAELAASSRPQRPAAGSASR